MGFGLTAPSPWQMPPLPVVTIPKWEWPHFNPWPHDICDIPLMYWTAAERMMRLLYTLAEWRAGQGGSGGGGYSPGLFEDFDTFRTDPSPQGGYWARSYTTLWPTTNNVYDPVRHYHDTSSLAYPAADQNGKSIRAAVTARRLETDPYAPTRSTMILSYLTDLLRHRLGARMYFYDDYAWPYEVNVNKSASWSVYNGVSTFTIQGRSTGIGGSPFVDNYYFVQFGSATSVPRVAGWHYLEWQRDPDTGVTDFILDGFKVGESPWPYSSDPSEWTTSVIAMFRVQLSCESRITGSPENGERTLETFVDALTSYGSPGGLGAIDPRYPWFDLRSCWFADPSIINLAVEWFFAQWDTLRYYNISVPQVRRFTMRGMEMEHLIDWYAWIAEAEGIVYARIR